MKEQLDKLKLKFDDVDPQQISLTEPLQEYLAPSNKTSNFLLITELQTRTIGTRLQKSEQKIQLFSPE